MNDLYPIWQILQNPKVSEVNYLQFAFLMLLAFLFGILLKLLYRFYFQENGPQDSSLARGLVLLTPTLTAIFWMIQTSVVLSFGLLGTLSLIRFRAPIKRVEDIAFIVIMLAVSIALATNVPLIALIVMGFVFIYALFNNSNLSLLSNNKMAIVTFNTRKIIQSEDVIEALKRQNLSGECMSSRAYDGITSYVFNIKGAGKVASEKIHQVLIEIDAHGHTNVFYPNGRLGG